MLVLTLTALAFATSQVHVIVREHLERMPGWGYSWGDPGDETGWWINTPTITDPVTGTFSVNFNFDPAGEIQRTTLLLARGPRPIPQTAAPTGWLVRPSAGGRPAR